MIYQICTEFYGHTWCVGLVNKCQQTSTRPGTATANSDTLPVHTRKSTTVARQSYAFSKFAGVCSCKVIVR